jgi:hypothetical protein
MTIGRINFALFAAFAAVPTVLHLLSLSALWFVRLSRPLTQRPATLLIERLEEAPNGVFTTIGIGLGAVTGILSAAAKLFE